jgi:HK97 family phage major capsid protein
MADFQSVDELQTRLAEVKARQEEINNEYRAQQLPNDVREEWNALGEEREHITATVEELEVRARVIGANAQEEDRIESGAHFQTARPGSVRGEDIYDLTTVRERNPSAQAGEMRDRALRSVESKKFPNPDANREVVQGHIEGLMNRVQNPIHDPSNFSRYLLETGSPVYERAWEKLIAAQMQNRPPILTPEEQRAASVGTTTAGGFAVPYTLDPTIIPTGNWSVNPWRAISRVETISGSNEWRGVSAGDLTATRRAEAAEVADNMVTLAQPTAVVSRVDAFVPFSFEIDQDWGGFRGEIARLFQQAKDNEEAAAFATGNGTAPNPQGVVTGATTIYTTAGTAAFVVADLYGVKNALPPRFRPNAQWVGEQTQYDRIRQFDTQGGAQIYIDNLQLPTTNDAVPTPGNLSARVLGKPANECSQMDSVLTSGSELFVYGDFNYYLIVDRIGMSVEVVQHLFHTATNYPSGQRGLLAFWRNTGKVLSAAAFRTLRTL